jgi:long-chain acyl-CoA synthetase
MFLEDPGVALSDPALYDSALAQWWSFGELREAVGRVAKSLDWSEKALAFCFCRNDFASVAWYLAAIERGHAVALLDEAMAPEFKQRLIELYAPEFLLSSADCPVYAAAGYTAAAPPGEGSFLWKRPWPDSRGLHPDLAVLLSTSGSTGSPKLVRLTERNLTANAHSIVQAIEMTAADRAISSLPFHYSFGLSVLHTHLLSGAPMVLTNQGLTSPGFWQVFREMQCTSFAGVPYSYQILQRLGLDGLKVPSLDTMLQAGGKLHNDLAARFHESMEQRGGRFFVMYGQTEASARIAVMPHRRLPGKLGSAGIAIPDGRMEILVDGVPTSEPGQTGELVYTGPNVMLGYATVREDLALGDVQLGRLSTGDSAYLDGDGFVFIGGRLKRDAKLFGLRINMDEIEGLLRVYGPTAVVAAGEKLRIFCEHGDEEAFRKYRQSLAQKLNLHHSAFDFRRVEQLPLNANGKIDYQRLS